jgi:hypothetical protein
MYERIAELMCRGNRAEQDLARKIILWLLYSKRPMTDKELQEAVSPKSGDNSSDDDSFHNFDRAVVMSCAGLVERRTLHSTNFDSEISSFQFIHLSVKEYFLSLDSHDRSYSKQSVSAWHSLLVSRTEALVEMARECLLTLSFKLPTHPLCGSLKLDMTPSQLHSTLPFCAYASCYWIDHLYGTMTQGIIPEFIENSHFRQVLESLSRFLALKEPIMAWIEASYVLRIVPSWEMLQQWTTWVRRNKSSFGDDNSLLQRTLADCLELSRYLKVLHADWGSQLLESPKCIWEEITAFTPSRLLSQTPSTKYTALVKDPPKDQLASSKYLSKISEMSADGRMVAILSIWPSKYGVNGCLSLQISLTLWLGLLREMHKAQ